MTRQAQTGDTVKVHYTGRLSDGTVFDTSDSRGPLEFTLGGGRLIAGFDEAVLGMSADESKTVTLSSEKAYGPYNPEMLMVVDRKRLPADMRPEIGENFQLPGPSGNALFVTVTDVCEATVTFDANHPLAGKDLTFDIQLVEIA